MKFLSRSLFQRVSRMSHRSFSLAAANISHSENTRLEYLQSLKQRLDHSWAAGLVDYFPNAQNLVPKEEVIFILGEALKALQNEANIIEIEFGEPEESFTVVGDTHGQYYDLLNLFKLNGTPSTSNRYLFNGDFVDRGSFSFQTAFLLLAYKSLLPNDVFLTRGNHETVDMNVMYGFFHEVMAKYDKEVMEKFWTVFSNLPLGCVLKNSNFPSFSSIVLHGGLFQDKGVTLEELNQFDRSVSLANGPQEQQPRESRLMHDCLWSDPQLKKGRSFNRARGGGLLFGPDVTKSFLERNKLNLLIRSHQVRKRGWSEEHNGQCITVFSAPDYCDSSGNLGAYLKFTNEKAKPDIYEFEPVPHPPLIPMAHMEAYRNSKL